MSTPIPADGWRVTGQTQITQPDETGRFVEGLVVSFVTGLGHAGSVFIPLSAATPDNVRVAIEARAATMNSIAMLDSTQAGQ